MFRKISEPRHACNRRVSHTSTYALLMLAAALNTLPSGIAFAQAVSPPDSSTLTELVRHALDANPELRAAEQRVRAALARVKPAGALPDPALMIGIQNLPLGSEATEPGSADAGKPDMMTMKMVGVGQTLPYPGKISLRRRAARLDVTVAEAEYAGARVRAVQQVKDAYYRLAYLDHALALLRRNAEVAATLISVADARYAVGLAAQQDALKARHEASRFAEEASALTEERRAVLAQLNAALARPSDTPLAQPEIPVHISNAAVAASSERVRFTSLALGARAAGSPLPALSELQTRAAQNNPEIRAHEAMIAAQALRVELARKGTLPDFDMSLEYGQRSQRPDMITARVSIPLPLHKGARQDQEVAEARALLAALEAEHHAKLNALNARLAELTSEAERARTQLALLKAVLIPQARATLESATASYQVSRIDFATLLDNQTVVFNEETEYFRLLSDFARKVAELESVVGGEVIR